MQSSRKRKSHYAKSVFGQQRFDDDYDSISDDQSANDDQIMLNNNKTENSFKENNSSSKTPETPSQSQLKSAFDDKDSFVDMRSKKSHATLFNKYYYKQTNKKMKGHMRNQSNNGMTNNDESYSSPDASQA